MAYKTINLAPATYARLTTYKAAGRTFDEVVRDLMDRVPPERVSAEVLREHRRGLREMDRGEYITLKEYRKAAKPVGAGRRKRRETGKTSQT